MDPRRDDDHLEGDATALSDEELIAYIESTPAAKVTDAGLVGRYFELKYGPPPVAHGEQQRECERRQRMAASPVALRQMRVPRGRERHPGRTRARRTRAAACAARRDDPGDDGGDGPSELPAVDDGPALFDCLQAITVGLDGPQRMALFWRLPEAAQDVFWADLAARSRRRWTA